MKCHTCRDLLTAYLKDELDDEKKAGVEEHLAQCAECATEAEGARKVLVIVDRASEPSIVQLVNEIIEGGIEAGASDIHIQRSSDHVSVRYRVDGVLHETRKLDRSTYLSVVDRIKQMADMSVIDRNTPQDGRLHIRYGGKNLDIRISTMPAVLGQSVVMRILDRTAVPLGLDRLGLRGGTREKVEALIRRPCGLFIVTGPTGSGKTTTLYSLLEMINRREIHTMSVEDPVEYQIDGITQIHLNTKAGLDFPTAMRHCMRQDPDVVMCGEVRDLDTARIAVQVALTGHLVLTALHTNDSVGVIRRLADIGLERFLIADSLLGAHAQRLVRLICTNCIEEYAPSSEELAWLREAGIETSPAKLWKGAGCEHCRDTGHRGRTAVHEVLEVDGDLQAMLSENADLPEIERVAAGKVVPMRHDAAQKVLQGEVPAQEAMRVLAFTPKYE
jgi:type II secretory ATPase GspE/PulE/Tfp pilus assembly ATPase PilB-like protein